MAIKTYHNGTEINVLGIRLKQRVNSISSADISIIDAYDEYTFEFLDEIEIYNDDKIIFRGIIVQCEKVVDGDITYYTLFVCDPLYKMKLQRTAGGIVGKSTDILNDICNEIGVVNEITVKDYLTANKFPFKGDILVFPDGYDGNYSYTDVISKFSKYDTLPDTEKTIQFGQSVSDIWIKLNGVQIATDEYGTYYGIVFNNLLQFNIKKIQVIATNSSNLSISWSTGGAWTTSSSNANANHIATITIPQDGDLNVNYLNGLKIGGTVYDTTQPVELYVRIIGDFEGEAKISLWYDNEITKFQVLQDLSQYHLFNFYYDAKTNSLRFFEQNYGDENIIQNITKYTETVRDTIQNRLRIKNFK